MAGCRDCKYFKTDVDLPFPVCTLHEFHFTTDFTPCESFTSNAYSSSSSSSSSKKGGKGLLIGIVIALVIGFIAVVLFTRTEKMASVEPVQDQIEMAGDTKKVEPKTARVNSSNGLNLRKGPSTSDEKITAMPSNATVTVLKEENGWCYVRYNDKEGWCSADYLIIED